MPVAKQEVQQSLDDDEEAYEESAKSEAGNDSEIESEDCVATEETIQPRRKKKRPGLRPMNNERSGFTHGLSVGLGIGCIATFVMMWITVFFTPQLPSAITYEAMLAVFIYPLIYLLAVGLIALTAGIVTEYNAVKTKS